MTSSKQTSKDFRESYYVVFATAEENESMGHHFSRRFANLASAEKEATLRWKSNDFVRIEKYEERKNDFGNWPKIHDEEAILVEISDALTDGTYASTSV